MESMCVGCCTCSMSNPKGNSFLNEDRRLSTIDGFLQVTTILPLHSFVFGTRELLTGSGPLED